MDEKSLARLCRRYERVFDQLAPQPLLVTEAHLAEILEDALANGQPVSWDRDLRDYSPSVANA